MGTGRTRGIERMICSTCGEDTVIEVNDNFDRSFFSCHNEECSQYAILLVKVEGGFITFSNIMKGLMKVVGDEQDNISEG